MSVSAPGFVKKCSFTSKVCLGILGVSLPGNNWYFFTIAIIVLFFELDATNHPKTTQR